MTQGTWQSAFSDLVNKGKTWFEEPELDEKLAKAIENGRLTATVDGESAVEKSDFIISIVPLILDEEKKPVQIKA